VRLVANDPAQSALADEAAGALAQAGVAFEVIPALRSPWAPPQARTRAERFALV